MKGNVFCGARHCGFQLSECSKGCVSECHHLGVRVVCESSPSIDKTDKISLV